MEANLSHASFIVVCAIGASQKGANSGFKLRGFEWLCQVIVCACIKSSDPLIGGSSGSNN